MAELQPLMETLPAVRGRMRSCVPLGQVTWFRVGGPAEVMFRPEDVDDLVDFMANKPANIPVMAMGVGSNLLVRDGGIDGVVVRLGRGAHRIRIFKRNPRYHWWGPAHECRGLWSRNQRRNFGGHRSRWGRHSPHFNAGRHGIRLPHLPGAGGLDFHLGDFPY
jgi:hypothetical protein